MKNSKKLVALVLAMVMIFALTASVFAATNSSNSTMNVTITIKGNLDASTISNPDAIQTVQVCSNKTYTITSGSTVYHLIKTMSDMNSEYAYGAVWKTVYLTDEDGNPTGGTGQALISLSNKIQDTTSDNKTRYTNNTWSSIGKTIKTVTPSSFGNTLLCSYEGYDWIYTVNGEEVEDKYMDQYVLHAGDSVELTYQYATDSWTEFDLG